MTNDERNATAGNAPFAHLDLADTEEYAQPMPWKAMVQSLQRRLTPLDRHGERLKFENGQSMRIEPEEAARVEWWHVVNKTCRGNGFDSDQIRALGERKPVAGFAQAFGAAFHLPEDSALLLRMQQSEDRVLQEAVQSAPPVLGDRTADKPQFGTLRPIAKIGTGPSR
jgi:hypothetical protein